MKNKLKLSMIATLMALSFGSQAELVNSELVRSFNFNNGSLTDSVSGNDLEKQGHDTGVSDVTFTTDRFGNENSAVAFDGKGAFLKWRQGELELTNAYLISFWIKSHEFGLAVKDNGYRNSNTYWFDNRAPNYVGDDFYISGGTSTQPRVGTYGAGYSSIPNTGDWFHYMHYRNDTINAVYINGELTSSGKTLKPNVNIAGDFALASANYTAEQYNLNGAIDDLIIMSGDYDATAIASTLYTDDSGNSVNDGTTTNNTGGASGSEANNVPVNFAFAGGLAMLGMFSRRALKA